MASHHVRPLGPLLHGAHRGDYRACLSCGGAARRQAATLCFRLRRAEAEAHVALLRFCDRATLIREVHHDAAVGRGPRAISLGQAARSRLAVVVERVAPRAGLRRIGDGAMRVGAYRSAGARFTRSAGHASPTLLAGQTVAARLWRAHFPAAALNLARHAETCDERDQSEPPDQARPPAGLPVPHVRLLETDHISP